MEEDHKNRDEDSEYKYDTKVTFWISMPSNHSAMIEDSFVLGEILSLTPGELEKLSDERIEALVEDAEREWVGNQIEYGWFKR